MKLLSWNVNGIRAGFNKDTFKQAFDDSIWKGGADIIAIQETKCEPTQLKPEQLNYYGYSSAFESAKNRKGYSGVAVYVRPGINYKVLHATLDKKDFYDEEGRTIVLEFNDFYFINCYWPNGGKSEEHYEYKLEYYKHFLELTQKLEKKTKHILPNSIGIKEGFLKPVIFCGDINATNADIDLARPKENAGKLGCTEPERKALAKFVENFVDTYRHINGDKVQYTWWDMKTMSREKNVGWRIDYFYTSKSLEEKIVNAQIHDNILGSDHCPISIEVDI